MTDLPKGPGVSQATVSLVLGGVKNARISEDTREKVRAIAEKMGYLRRPGLARSSDVRGDWPAD